MPGALYLCGGEDACPRHGKYIYFCRECHEEWQLKNPHTTEAIAKFAAGKCSRAAVDDAKKKDREANRPSE